MRPPAGRRWEIVSETVARDGTISEVHVGYYWTRRGAEDDAQSLQRTWDLLGSVVALRRRGWTTAYIVRRAR